MPEGIVDEVVKLRLAFLCAGDPLSLLSWSGTPYHMLEALRQEFDVVEVVRTPWASWFSFARKVVRRLSGGAIDLYWVPFLVRMAASKTISRLEKTPCDVVVAVAVSPIAAELTRKVPVAYFSDATFSLMADYNLGLRRLAGSLKKSAHAIESRCLQESKVSFLPSDWARNSALRDHGGDPSRVIVVPWGANMRPQEIIPPEQRATGHWRLLFVGTDWVGKGGDVALDTVAELRRRGYSVQLDVVGSAPPEPRQIEGVVFHGFLDKRNEEQRKRLKRLFREAHMFFLPTRSEALGIVFAEAASYALPSVSYDTGGISAMVVDGETGRLVPEGSSAEIFADALSGLMNDREAYLRMSHAALRRSEQTLNWPAWARDVRQKVTKLVGASGDRGMDAGYAAKRTAAS